MNLETKIIIYKFTPQVFTLTQDFKKRKLTDKKMALQSLARPPSNENFQWALTDSNRRPSACKADALNQLS